VLPASQIHLAPAEAKLADVLHLLDQDGGGMCSASFTEVVAVGRLRGDVNIGKVLPDELQHQQLVEVRVEQRSYDGSSFQLWLCARSARFTFMQQGLSSGLGRRNPLKEMASRRKFKSGTVGVAL